jgi:hypothetical protein
MYVAKLHAERAVFGVYRAHNVTSQEAADALFGRARTHFTKAEAFIAEAARGLEYNRAE